MLARNLIRLLAACAALTMGASHAQFKNWLGNQGSNWSTAQNWSGGLTPGAPASGESLNFASTTNKTSVNDLSGLTLFRIDFNATGHTLNGNGIAVTDGLRCAPAVDATINFPVDFQANNVVVSTPGMALSCSVRAAGGIAGSGTIMVGAYTIFAIAAPSTFSGQVHLDECRNFGCGRLRLEGASIPNANVFATNLAQVGITAEVSGNGAIGNATRVSISPGTSTTVSGVDNGVGLIATKDLDVSGRLFNVDLAGMTPGSGHDQVAVTGTVTLGNAALRVRMAPGFAPIVGQILTLIANDGADAVSGTFNGLPEGSMVADKGFELRVSYVGGDGNDVTLQVAVAPKVWTGAAGALWSNPGNWAGGVVPQFGDRLRFPAGAANLANTNDLAAGLFLHSIGFDGKDFTLSGNPVALTNFLESTIPTDPNLGSGHQFNTIALPVEVLANPVRVTHVTQQSIIRLSGGLAGTGPINLDQGTLALAGSGTFSGNIAINCFQSPASFCGQLFLEAANYPSANVVAGGNSNNLHVVAGTGTIGTLTGVTLKPGPGPCCAGSNPGLVTTGGIAPGSISMSPGDGLGFSITGTVAGTGYDQVRVNGAVNLSSKQLFVEQGFPFPTFVPTPGQVFTIIDNDGTDPIVGRFNGTANGATVQPLGGNQFRISYIGGDGNDVTLTALSGAPRLVNISTRMQVLTGDDVLIGGFIIGGNQPKSVVVRARGPSLAAQGIAGALQDPIMQLFSGQTPLLANDDWQAAPNATLIQASDLAPPDPRESAILMTLQPGAYTAIVAGAGNSTGVGMIEVFEADQPEVPLVNIATRGRVQTGDNVLIGGFIIQGNSPQTVVVRARGPSLTAQGVPGVLANPTMQLFRGPTVIATNDNWQQASNAAAIQSSGFAPSDPNESAILMTLQPGAYTAIVSGVAGTTGVAIIEVFRN